MKSSMLNIIVIIVVAVMILLFMITGSFCRKSFERGDERADAISYESLYFLDNSLVNGNAVIRAIKQFSESELMIQVKTKQLDEPEVYNWDGEKAVEGYDEGRNGLDPGYINKAALFRVCIEKKNDRIICISFCQE